MDLEYHKVYTSRDVVFHETIFPSAESTSPLLFPLTTPAVPLEEPSFFQHTEPTIIEPSCTESPATTQQAAPTP